MLYILSSQDQGRCIMNFILPTPGVFCVLQPRIKEFSFTPRANAPRYLFLVFWCIAGIVSMNYGDEMTIIVQPVCLRLCVLEYISSKRLIFFRCLLFLFLVCVYFRRAIVNLIYSCRASFFVPPREILTLFQWQIFSLIQVLLKTSLYF